MSVIPIAAAPGKVAAPSAAYPYGEARDITVPGDGTGSPWIAIFLNDIWGIFQSLISNSSVSPNGNADEVGDSDYFRAMQELFGAVVGSVSDLRGMDSSQLQDGTLVAVASIFEFSFYEVTTGTVTDDGVQRIVFTDDANRYASRVASSYIFNWIGTFAALGGVDAGRYLLPGWTYSSTAPATADFRFPAGAKLDGINFSNKGVEEISGLAFYADSSPASSPTPATLEHQLTPRVDVAGGETRFIPVTNPAPDTGSPMALAFTARDIGGSTAVTIQFVFSLVYDAQDSQSEDIRRGDLLAPVEAVGVVDLAERIADNNYPPERERFSFGNGREYASRNFKVLNNLNLQTYTEDPQTGAEYTLASASASIDTTNTVEVNVDGRNVKLTRILDTSAVTLLTAPKSGGFFTDGARYMISCYVLKATGGIARFHMRDVPTPYSANPGHGQRMATERPRRVWSVVEGYDQFAVNGVQVGDDPTATYASGGVSTHQDPAYFEANLAALIGDLSDVWVGGFQIDTLDAGSPDDIDGICMIGDEVLAGIDTYPAFSAAIRAAGNPDQIESLQVSRWLEMELNARVFNRAIEGDTLTDMAARWATDITAIATPGDQARYVVIQGGALDIVTDMDAAASAATTLAALKTRIAALKTLADADGLIPVFLTISPHQGIYGDRNGVRQDYNAWLQTAYPLVVDINQVLESSDGQSIVRQPLYSPDGFNLDAESKRVVGQFLARQWFWTLPRPKPYQYVPTTTPETIGLKLGGVQFYTGSGSPNGVQNGSIGDVYLNETPTGIGDATWRNTTGGISGWAAHS